MIDKITLYREVLELEPGSRVFFPLAKLLADKEPAEAILILKKGLSRHPDHIEARIFLIELLSANDGDADLDNELEIVSAILRNYPSFWKIWSAHLAQNSELHDAALAISFFGAGLSGRPVSWTDVIAHGLNALLLEDGDETTPLLPSSAEIGTVPHRAAVSIPSSVPASVSTDQSGNPSDTSPIHDSAKDFQATASSVNAAQETVHQENISQVDIALDDIGQVDVSQANISRAGIAQDVMASTGVSANATNHIEDYATDFGDDEDEGEEPFSLRTRTMADLLAEQGDYDGAIDIYNEILTVVGETERLEVSERLRELEELRQQSAVPGTPKKDTSMSPDSDGGKLVSLLESLASRFENRAR